MSATGPADPALAVPDGLPNFRDVGGLPAGPGRRVRHGVLFRSGSPQFLTPAGGADVVSVLGVRSEIDLRRDDEARREGRGPLAGTGVRLLAFPLESHRSRAAQHVDVPLVTDWVSASEHYLTYLDISAGAVAGAVAALAEPGTLPALVHCAAGKDRTGVVVAFALSAVGVTDEDVAAEYARDPDGVRDVVARLRAQPGYAALIDTLPEAAHITPAEYMERFLALVRDRHGSPRDWLAARGVGDDVLARLAAALTEPLPG